MSNCTYILTRGPRKGDQCDSIKGCKTFGDKTYCYEHMRNKSVQNELTNSGFNLEEVLKPAPINVQPKTVPISRAPGPQSLPMEKPVKPRPKPIVVKEQAPVKLSFVDSFQKGLEEEVDNEEINYDKLYDDYDKGASQKVDIPEVEIEEDEVEEEEEKPSVLPEHLRQSEEDKFKIASFASKHVISMGIQTMALIAETTCRPSLNGFQDNVVLSEHLNLVVDQLAVEYNELLGIGELTPTYQFFVVAGVLGMQTFMLNRMAGTQPESIIPLMGAKGTPQVPIPKNKDFSVPYPE